jgi:tRNA nucleotidyltransferase (CCA-adding enzyme)
MQSFIVGGAVRDQLLGLPVNDRDHVVVGATVEQMQAQGFIQVGRDFPVFLHPESHEEYALARTERKQGTGYRGFLVHASPDVTLEQDLSRRDLTINAMALTEAGELIDPYGGQRDLNARLLRHVSVAFAEDPVRILRVARFAARFTEFTVAPETSELMRTMVRAGEADALVAERVWQEISRGLLEVRPSRMVEVLDRCGALERVAAGLNLALDSHGATRLDALAESGHPLSARFAAWILLADVSLASIDQLCDFWRVPAACRDMATMLVRENSTIMQLLELNNDALLSLIERCDGLRRDERFMELIGVAAALAQEIDRVSERLPHVRRALNAIGRVDAGALARSAQPADIPQVIRAARLAALNEASR